MFLVKNVLFAIDNTKAGEIISLFQDKELDAKMIAEKVGFDSNRIMGQYMESEGYRWDSELENYVKEARDRKKYEPPNEKKYDANAEEEEVKYNHDLEQYLPLLKLIKEKEEQFRTILESTNCSGQKTRYAVPGNIHRPIPYWPRLFFCLFSQLF